MSAFEDLDSLRQQTTTEVYLPCGTPVKIVLDGYKATDNYATNLKLTGHTNWFGSMNVCNLIAEMADELFVERTDSTEPLRVLELGSGLGRAGIMAAKILSLRGRANVVVLTDGEEDVVQQLCANCRKNEVPDGLCRRLWWGAGTDLEEVQTAFPTGFDLILGCDLIYGPLGAQALQDLMITVRALLKPLASTGQQISAPGAVPCCFLLAFTRRGAVTVDELLEAGRRHGLCGHMLETGTFDIFENQVDEDSLFWANTVVRFHWERECDRRDGLVEDDCKEAGKPAEHIR